MKERGKKSGEKWNASCARELFCDGSRLRELALYSVVLQRCLLSRKSMWNPQVSGENNSIVWPVYSIVCFIYWLYNTALLEDCINKQYKYVVLLLYPKSITLIFSIMFHRISCWQTCTFFKKNFFYAKHLVLFLKKKNICDVKISIQQCHHWLEITYNSWLSGKSSSITSGVSVAA